MDYADFLSTVVEQIKFKVPSDAKVQVQKVTKNNSLHLDGLTIFYGDSKVSPNVYMNTFYEDYKNGQSMEETLKEILAVFERCAKTCPQFKEDSEYLEKPEENRIFYRLVNYRKNQELLREMPHIPYLDLAITFHCLVNSSPDGIGSFRVTNHMMDLWKMSEKELYKMAKKNTPKLFPGLIRPMHELLEDLINQNLGAEPKPDNNNSFFMEQPVFPEEANFMYVLSNNSGINGATAILYPNLIKPLADSLSTDFCVIPSSIHEMLLIPAKISPPHFKLDEMVYEVNRSQVPLEDVLSDHAYYYQRSSGKLKIG